mgnify:CR=1 FL=1
MKVAFVYAGQGSQAVGMGQSLYNTYPTAKRVFDSIDLDFDVKKLCFEGPLETLSQTQYTQPCMVAVAIAATEVLKEQGIQPEMAAGLSLGEYSALYAAGVFDEKTALELVRYRGQIMEQAVQGMDSKMIAVLGLERKLVEQAVQQGSAVGIVEAANYNCPGQIVLGGQTQAVEKAGEYALQLGAKRVAPLNVSGPFHTSLLSPASKKLEQKLTGVTFGNLRIPVVFNATAKELEPEQSIAQLLTRQIMSPVYLEDSIGYLIGQGVDTFIEIGPGKVLSGFIKKITKEAAVYQVEDAQTLSKTVENIREGTK